MKNNNHKLSFLYLILIIMLMPFQVSAAQESKPNASTQSKSTASVASKTQNASSSKIGSVYGVNLGDNTTEVVSALRSQGKDGTWHNKDGNRIYQINHVKLGVTIFDWGEFIFSGSKLDKVKFGSRHRAGIWDNFPGQQEIDERNFSVMQTNYNRNYNTMRQDLISKYGEPTFEDGKYCKWVDGNYEIVMEIWENSEYVPVGISSTLYKNIQLTLTYQKAVPKNMNF